MQALATETGLGARRSRWIPRIPRVRALPLGALPLKALPLKALPMWAGPMQAVPTRNLAMLAVAMLAVAMLAVATLLTGFLPSTPFSTAYAGEAPVLIPLAEGELREVTGGCSSRCRGRSASTRSRRSVASRGPERVGGAYWEYAYRTLIARPPVAGNLIWHRVNNTDQHWGPFDVTYTYRRSHNWSVGGSVPRGFVRAQIGGEFETTRKLVERFTIPPRTYYKFFVAYPYERWRYYYRRYQDYSNNSRKVVATGTATVYDRWTKTSLVEGRAY